MIGLGGLLGDGQASTTLRPQVEPDRVLIGGASSKPSLQNRLNQTSASMNNWRGDDHVQAEFAKTLGNHPVSRLSEIGPAIRNAKGDDYVRTQFLNSLPMNSALRDRLVRSGMFGQGDALRQGLLGEMTDAGSRLMGFLDRLPEDSALRARLTSLRDRFQRCAA